MMHDTKHAQQGLSHRDIDVDAVSLTISFGVKIERNGAAGHYLGRRQLSLCLPSSEADSLEGTTAIRARDGGVVTV